MMLYVVCHVTSIIYYLSHARHQSCIQQPAEKLNRIFQPNIKEGDSSESDNSVADPSSNLRRKRRKNNNQPFSDSSFNQSDFDIDTDPSNVVNNSKKTKASNSAQCFSAPPILEIYYNYDISFKYRYQTPKQSKINHSFIKIHDLL